MIKSAEDICDTCRHDISWHGMTDRFSSACEKTFCSGCRKFEPFDGACRICDSVYHVTGDHR